MSDVLAKKHESLSMTKEIMDSLREMFSQPSWSLRHKVVKYIYTKKMKEGTSVREHVRDMMMYLNIAEVNDSPINEKPVVISHPLSVALFCSLPLFLALFSSPFLSFVVYNAIIDRMPHTNLHLTSVSKPRLLPKVEPQCRIPFVLRFVLDEARSTPLELLWTPTTRGGQSWLAMLILELAFSTELLSCLPICHLGPPKRRTTEEEEVKGKHPNSEDSVYHQPTLNSTGALPPEKPPMFKSSVGKIFSRDTVFSALPSLLFGQSLGGAMAFKVVVMKNGEVTVQRGRCVVD
ncbi:gag/pol protein [Cucumis melo var. makuwa]|uniref:Gag/pol protein n=1 Tax=Cucumis melo var. makuwa TaxID=1194695 RepID=A0A5D3BD21_CUCMM|nr:gag/pol protein [Cucumis melo var. makuwa]